MNLQIKQRLFILVAVALAALVAVGAFSFAQAGKLNNALNETIADDALILATVDDARGAQVAFKIQVQEWKNILLRGKDPAQFDKYLKGFDQEEQKVKAQLDKVKAAATRLGIADRLKVDAVAATFDKLGPAYREALKQYDRETADPAAVVDKLVKGIDREPTKALDTLVDVMQKFAAESNAREIARAGDVFASVRSGLIAFSLVAVAVLVLLALIIVRSITVPLARLAETMTEIADTGNLTRRADSGKHDEIGRMATAFNTMMGRLQKLIGEVSAATTRVDGASQQLTGSATALAEVSGQQSEAVASSAAAIEELTVAIAAVSETAQDVHARAVDSVEQTNEGSRKVSHLADEIDRIQRNMTDIAATVAEFVRSTQAITSMTQEVRDIADQTNLLALNAAIEAARAGEAGRGFAVVADEVRKLAEKSGKSASEIDSVTRSIMAQSDAVQAAIGAGEEAIGASTALAADVENVLNGSRDAVERSAHGVNEITSSVAEQKTASTEIARSMERIASMVEENSSAAHSVSSATDDLRHLAQTLAQAVAGFRVA